jgi:hypothetical protein
MSSLHGRYRAAVAEARSGAPPVSPPLAGMSPWPLPLPGPLPLCPPPVPPPSFSVAVAAAAVAGATGRSPAGVAAVPGAPFGSNRCCRLHSLIPGVAWTGPPVARSQPAAAAGSAVAGARPAAAGVASHPSLPRVRASRCGAAHENSD